MNDTLKKLHMLLMNQAIALAQALHTADDDAIVAKIQVEMAEVQHRADIAQQLLFAKASADLDAMMGEISKAQEKLASVVAELEDAAIFVGAVAAFLACVDEALALAKTLV